MMLERKPWQPLERTRVERVPATVGVYELGDEEGRVVYIGAAGAREPFGLRGRLLRHLNPGSEINRVIRERARLFRYEVNVQYTTRWIELLKRFLSECGRLPVGNAEALDELPPSVRRTAMTTKGR
jgi:hypothetical protein